MNLRRLWALLVKEHLLMRREISNLAIGILMPVILLVIFGYGLSLDISNVRVCLSVPYENAISRRIADRFAGSDVFKTSIVRNPKEAAEKVAKREADVAVLLPMGLPRQQEHGTPKVMVIVSATQAAMAKAYETAVKGIVSKAVSETLHKQPRIVVKPRIYYNPSSESRLFLVPGVVVIVMAVIGCILTALQMAGEYERGTLESLYATPVRPLEIILAKIVNNFLLGMLGFAVCLLFSHYVFKVPVRGSLIILFLGSACFLTSQMALGLLISSLTKSQFVSAELSMVVSFMPVFMLSGFLYEIPNMPAFLQITSLFLPARYYVEFLQTSLLVGNIWPILIKNMLILAGFTVAMLALCRLAVRKSSVGGKA